jgi:aminoglycoside 6'-N-acetyltransferase I
MEIPTVESGDLRTDCPLMTAVRPVIAADAGAWLQMRQQLWPEDSDLEHRLCVDRYLAGDRREPAEVLLAINDRGQPVGFAELAIRNIVDGCSSDRVAYLEGWYVDAEARRTGIGRLLIRAAEEWACAQGCTEFGSDALLDDEISHAAHLNLGFVETGKVRTFRKSIGSSQDGNG